MTNRTVPAPGPAEGLLEVPAAVLTLLGLPALEDLKDAQVRGRACVWCGTGPLTAETAVDYGEQLSPISDDADSARMRWYPRSCRECRPRTGQRAYRALLDHAPGCAECCAAAPGCEIGRGLTRLVREGRR
ncbi:hypothetical protein [Streptomyces cyslabdanicus]|uniref:hypothetical protein n=1 Tax=Streptomyces cyslabdanicus TaxID=1470456 RepID=UPI004043E4AF